MINEPCKPHTHSFSTVTVGLYDDVSAVVFKQDDGFVFHGYHLSQFYDVAESFIGHVRPPK